MTLARTAQETNDVISFYVLVIAFVFGDVLMIFLDKKAIIKSERFEASSL